MSTPTGSPPLPGAELMTPAPREAMPAPPARSSRRNLIVAIIDVVGFGAGNMFYAPQTVLQEFMTHLTRSNVLIGFTTSVAWSTISLTQLFVVNHVERLPVKRPYVMVAATFERLMLFLLAIVTPLLAVRHPSMMVAALLILVSAHYLFMGCSMPAYSAMITKVIPARQRGWLYGLGGTLANVLTLGAGFLIPTILTAKAWWGGFPNGFAFSFWIAAIVLTVSYLPLALIDEPAEKTTGPGPSPRAYVATLLKILRENRDFRLFVITGWFLIFGASGTAFYMTYAIRELHAPPGESGWFTVVISLGAMTALLWGILADRTNNRRVLFLAASLLIVSSVWAWRAPSLFWFYPVIFMTAVAYRGVDLASYNMILEFSPPAHVPRYVALAFALQFPPRLAAPLLSGVVADLLGFRAMFLFVGLSAILAIAALSMMQDPRVRREANLAKGDAAA